MSEHVTIRTATSEDLTTVNAFCAMEGFGAAEADDVIYVAESPAAETVGILRLVFDVDGVAHVNPVVVYPTWRRFGVGRTLIEHAHAEHGELRLVSRGSSRPFYEALGFEECPWDAIAPDVAEECSHCELEGECHPTPMRRRRS